MGRQNSSRTRRRKSRRRVVVEAAKLGSQDKMKKSTQFPPCFVIPDSKCYENDSNLSRKTRKMNSSRMQDVLVCILRSSKVWCKDLFSQMRR